MSEETSDDAVLGGLLEPALAQLAAELGSIKGLAEAEQKVIHEAAATALRDAVRLKTNRVLLVELNVARITGKLTATDSRARWREWAAAASEPAFWDSLAGHYPTLPRRLGALVDNRCAAALSLARRFAVDRSLLGGLLGTGTGDLVEIEFGAGDSHHGGQTVAILRCEAGRLVYKPRPLDIDAILARFLSRLLADEPAGTRIKVPDVVCRDGYGWAEHVAHRYCAGDAELQCFYRNLGHWLAVMRLLSGTDLHAENLVAVGPVPIVVDCETLFTPHPSARASGYGLAPDRAGALVGGTVLGTGLLPGRGLVLGWRGVDQSAIGSLPGQQPVTELPVIVDGGTDRARIGRAPVPVAAAANHPSPNPVLGRYWELVVTGFVELTQRLAGIDRAGELAALLAGFADVPIRVVLRSTESYAELGRMLWHPESLHDEPAARRRAADLLARQARNVPGRPADPAVIQAEVDELLDSDVPVFTTTPRRGRQAGPRGTGWGEAENLIDGALARWRAADLALERQVIESALVSAYLNEGWLPDQRRLDPTTVRTGDLDRRRRTMVAKIMRALAGSAVRAEDGTVTWIAPVLNRTGWAVLPLGLDLYSGLPGVAVLLAAYLSEMAGDRVDPVPEVPSLLEDVLRTIRAAERQSATDRAAAGRHRPAPPGGYIGLGSRIYGWLLLQRLGAINSHESHVRAGELVSEISGALAADPAIDLVHGMAGAVVPLIRLAESTGNADARAVASGIGRRLVSAARLRGDTAWWPNPGFPDGIGGLAHGATGIGWALSRLAAATGDAEAGAIASAAFRHEETLYDPDRGGWRDLRNPDTVVAAWCHGAGGIGIVAADLLREAPERWSDVLRRAATVCQAEGLGWNHTLCHGDLGVWEVLRIAIDAGAGPRGLDRHMLDGHVLGSLEQHGPVSGFARDAFAPGLLPGLGGVAYQLLRMHPDCTLPSVLLPDPGR